MDAETYEEKQEEWEKERGGRGLERERQREREREKGGRRWGLIDVEEGHSKTFEEEIKPQNFIFLSFFFLLIYQFFLFEMTQNWYQPLLNNMFVFGYVFFLLHSKISRSFR